MNDLEWMARNVHEAPSYCKTISVVRLDSGEGRPFFHHDLCGTHSTQEWLAERARLQNKPSWEDAPDWAMWLCQTSKGDWFFCESKQKPNADKGWDDVDDNDAMQCMDRGEVLGDWRDTLEPRPEEQVMDKDLQFIASHIDEWAEGAGWVSRCEDTIAWWHDKAPVGINWFTFTDVEKAWHDLKGGNGKKEWRGPEDGLPPIGEECEVYRNGEWEPCEIIAHIEQPMGTIAVFSYGREPGYGISGVDCLIPRYFRPVDVSRAEKARAVEDMVSVMDEIACCDLAIHPKIADALYKAGYRKQEPSE